MGGTRSSKFFEQGRIMLDGGEERFYTENLDNDGGSPIKILVSKGASVKIQGSRRLKSKNLQGIFFGRNEEFMKNRRSIVKEKCE